MNFRNFRYFLTVCEMGTINAAARKLYISQQSLSQNIRSIEQELGMQLFYRDNPLVLTDAGRCFRQTALDITARMDQMDRELAALRGSTVQELRIATLDYGIPDFMAPLLEEFTRRNPSMQIQLMEIAPGEPVPDSAELVIGARELGGHYKSKVLLYDHLVVCVSDRLLQQCYGASWLLHRHRLEAGDLHALEGCPFVRHHNTPLEALADMAFAQNSFQPEYLPIVGSANVMVNLCVHDRAAAILLEDSIRSIQNIPPGYRIQNVPEQLPAGYICYPKDTVLSNPARRFLDITQRYFNQQENE